VNIWGPSDLDFLLGAMRSFIPRKAMIHAHSFGLDQSNNATLSSPRGKEGSSTNAIVLIDDEVVRISAMFVRPINHKIILDSDWGKYLRPGDTAVVYACELPEIKGKFDPVKAASLGLKPGPKYRDLQLGKSVKSDSLDIMVIFILDLFPCILFF
jgi:ribonuclease Z